MTYDEWQRQKGRLFEIVLEPRGGANVRDSLALLAPGGRVVCYGVSSLVTGLRRSIPRTILNLLQTPLLTPIGLAMSNRGIFGVNLLKYLDTEQSRRMVALALGSVLEGFEKGRYRAQVGKIWRLEQTGKAHAFLQSRKGSGKQILLGKD